MLGVALSFQENVKKRESVLSSHQFQCQHVSANGVEVNVLPCHYVNHFHADSMIDSGEITVNNWPQASMIKCGSSRSLGPKLNI